MIPKILIQKIRFPILIALIIMTTGVASGSEVKEQQATYQHLVTLGDTWTALAWSFGIDEEQIRAMNPHPNRQQQPVVGKTVTIPISVDDLDLRQGILANSYSASLLELAVKYNQNSLYLALLNGLEHIWQPLLGRPIFIEERSGTPKELPQGFQSLDLMAIPVYPGQGQALRAEVDELNLIKASFAGQPVEIFSAGNKLVGLFATGAFFPPGNHSLAIEVEGFPLWSQPIRVIPGEWTFEEITLTGSAAAIDAESIRVERERLNSIWQQSTSDPLWETNFKQPIEQYLDISSRYGARRSYNGGPYSSYHEGLDFSAYGGTPVFAPAAGKVVLAEKLYVRGGAVIIDHGLGIYTGLYHMSEILVQAGQFVTEGQIIGRVGSTGLSTGNHLHWDLLVNGIWVDAGAWQQSEIACWILEGWGRSCRNE